jgi:membrane associated rhomboid family serine protease
MGNIIFDIARLIGGEKATPETRRRGASILFVIPVFLWLFAHFGKDILNKAGVAMLCLLFAASGIVIFLVTAFCAKVIPTKILFVLAAIAWLALIWAIGLHDYR